MLERRVSNQRQDLSSDQQMNYLLSWFVNWSDLQKVSPYYYVGTVIIYCLQEDFVPVLAEKMSNKWASGGSNNLCI